MVYEQVLAVHPDFLLRTQILDFMRSRWFNLSADGQHDVAAGFLREGQLELGIEALDNMPKNGVRVQGWLYDLAIHTSCHTGEFEEALRIMKTRVASMNGEEISPVIWFRLLEDSSQTMHHEGTSFVWNRRVRPGYLNPPSGVCLNVLKVAARRGDVDLATDVFRILGECGTIFTAEHYELLLETYTIAKDLRNAFSLLCVMHDTNIKPDLGTVRMLVYHMRVSQERRKKALALLHQLQTEREVPIVAMNALIESATFGNNLDEAIDYYKVMHDICVSPSRNVDTFNIILRGCRAFSRKDIAMFLASEMVALRIMPNALTYDRLMLICAKEDDFEDAFRYYFEMLDSGFKARLGTLSLLAKRAAETADSRTERLVEDIDAHGPVGRRLKTHIMTRYKQAQQAQTALDSREAVISSPI